MPSQIANVTPIRSSGWSVRAYASFITGGTPVATGTVTDTPPYPVGTAGNTFNTTYVTGAFTDVLPGMEVVFTDTATGAFKGRTHVTYTNAGAITAGSLPIREFAQANLNLVAGDTFRVYKEWRIHDKLVAALVGFPPDHRFYTDEGSNPPPVAISGGHYAGRVDVGQTYATVLTTAGSYTVDPDSGGSVTHLWTLPTGVTFAPGSASTDATPTLRAVQGEYTVYHAVTDSSNSKTTVQHIHLKVHNAANPPHQIRFTQDTATADSGFGGSVEIVSGATTHAAIPDGCLCIIWSEARNEALGSTTSYRNTANGRAHILCIGIVRRDTQSGAQDGSRKVSFEIISPLARLKEIASYSKVMEANATPDDWSEVKTLRVKRAIIQLIQFYTTYVESGGDLTFDSAFIDYLYPALYLQRSTFVDQVKELADGVDARMVCDRTGRFNLHTDPRFIPLADRAAITKTWNFLPRDVLTFEFPREHVDTVEKMKTSGFTGGASANTPLFSLYPGEAPGEGTDAPTKERLIVTDQDDLNARTGRYGAAIDRVYQDDDGLLYRAFPLTLTLRGIYDFFDFSKEYVNFTTSLARLARDVDLTKFLFCLQSTSVGYDYERGTATTTCVFDVVTNAAPGETFVPDADTSGIFDGQQPGYEPPFTVPTPLGNIISGGSGRLAFVSDDGYLYYTLTANAAEPVWSRFDLSLTGTALDYVTNPFSPRYLTGTGDVEIWVATSTRIYHVAFHPDTFTATVTQQAVLSSASLALRRIETERGVKNFAAVLTTYQGTGTKLTATADGATWGAEVTLNADGAGYAVPFLFLSPRSAGKVIAATSAATGASNLGKLSTNYGASFGSLSSPNLDITGQGAFAGHVPYHNNASESIAYFGWTDVWAGHDGTRRLYRANGATQTDISPTDGETFGAQFPRGIDSCPINRLRVVAGCRNGTSNTGASGDDTRVYYSKDGGDSWAHVAALASTVGAGAYWNVRAAGDNPNLFYAMGSAGRIALCTFDGLSQDLNGNLSTFSSPAVGFILNLFGF